MELEAAKKLVKKHMPGHTAFVLQANVGERYYKNENDILYLEKDKTKSGEEKEENPLRNADNRVPHNFHGTLVNQKASYMFTYPPLIDVGSKETNKKITDILGNKYAKVCKKLCVNASNSGIAWLHFWINADGRFCYGVIDSRQVIPVWTDDQDSELQAVLRTYNKTEDDGKTYIIYEIWTKDQCESYAVAVENPEVMMQYSIINRCIIDFSNRDSNVYIHEWERVPFIPFMNNDMMTTDLQNTKKLIDCYDKVYSGFMDDLEDIQEIIFILSGYGGTDLKEFIQDLKKFKTVNLDADGENPGLSTLTIDIPVEAREKMLTMTRRAIFEQGQGVDPQPENYGNASGEALKFMYTLLELKAGLMETEFRISIEEFISVVCKYLNVSYENINQTWTRNMIRSDKELADMCSLSSEIVSKKTLLKNHPFVEDVEEELEQIAKEEKENEEKEEQMMYGNAFSQKDVKQKIVEEEGTDA